MNSYINNLLSEDVQQYIEDNYKKNLADLALQKNPFPIIDKKILLEQLNGKKRAAKKLPTWYNQKGIIYPSVISMEQTSSEITAAYKAKIINKCTAIVDASGGFGVDAYYFSKNAESVVHCEMDEKLSMIVAVNNQTLGVKNITCKNEDSYQAINQINSAIDWIYVDPARRSNDEKRVFQFADCLPNVVALLPFYLKKAKNIMIKSAPFLDIKNGMQQLNHVKEIYIIAVENEVKELLWIIEQGLQNEPMLHAVNITKDTIQHQKANIEDDDEAVQSIPKKYLYEPNSALLKAGWFKKITQLWAVQKLHTHTHLYTSEELITNFEGRIFEIIKVIPYQKANYKEFENSAASVNARNFPINVASIRSKHKIKESDALYYFFTTIEDGSKIVIQAKKN